MYTHRASWWVMGIIVGFGLGCELIAAEEGGYEYVGQFGGGGPEQIWQPGGMIIDSAGILWVSDSGNSRIWKVNTSFQFIEWLGACWSEEGGNWHLAVDTDHSPLFGTGQLQFSFPKGMDVDRQGNIFIVDSQNNRIQKLSSTGTFLDQWSILLGSETPDISPSYLAIDSLNNVYVGDTGHNRVVRFSSAGVGSVFCTIDKPVGVAVDNTDNVYVVSQSNTEQKIWVYSSNGTFIRSFGVSGSGENQLNMPQVIKIGPDGNVYVTETGTVDLPNACIKVFTPEGVFVSGWGHYGDGDEFHFGDIKDLYFGPDGTIYVSDGELEYGTPGIGHHRIAMYKPNITTIPAIVDIDPDTINLKSNGSWVTAFITLPVAYSLDAIDFDSIAITRIETPDCSTCFTDTFLPLSSAFTPQVGDHDEDITPDLTVKFDRQALQALLTVGNKTITVSGQWLTGEMDEFGQPVTIPFKGTDTIRVINPANK